MEDVIRGKAFVVGDHIDTDQIIPAEHLSYNPADPAERRFFGKYALSGVPLASSGLPGGNVPFVADDAFQTEFAVVIGGKNFGCGSSREHAPLAIHEAGVRAVVAESYARIFYRNSINGAYLVPFETPERLIGHVETGDEIELHLATGVLRSVTRQRTWHLRPLGDAAEIVAAGGVFEYARQAGLLA